MILLFVLLLLCPTIAWAHPCDDPPQTKATQGSKLGWCHDKKDSQGFVLPTMSFKVVLNGVTTVLGPLSGIGAPSVSGQYYFEATFPVGLPNSQYPVSVV